MNRCFPVCRGERRVRASLTPKKSFDCGGGGRSGAGREISTSSRTYDLPIVAAAEFSSHHPADAGAAQPAIAVAVIVLDGFVVALYPFSNPRADDIKDGSLPVSLLQSETLVNLQ